MFTLVYTPIKVVVLVPTHPDSVLPDRRPVPHHYTPSLNFPSHARSIPEDDRRQPCRDPGLRGDVTRGTLAHLRGVARCPVTKREGPLWRPKQTEKDGVHRSSPVRGRFLPCHPNYRVGHQSTATLAPK